MNNNKQQQKFKKKLLFFFLTAVKEVSVECVALLYKK